MDFLFWNLPKFFQFMEIFFTSPKFEWSFPNLLKFYWDWNFLKWLWFYQNLNKALIVHPDISECSLLKFQWSYSIQLCFEQDCLKLPTIEWSCCKLPKFHLTGGPHTNVSNLFKCFYFHWSLNGLFLICPDIIEAVGPYPNAPNLLKCFSFYLKLKWSSLVGPNLMKAVGIIT